MTQSRTLRASRRLAPLALVAACVHLKVTSGGVFAMLALLVLGAVLWLRIPPRSTADR